MHERAQRRQPLLSGPRWIDRAPLTKRAGIRQEGLACLGESGAPRCAFEQHRTEAALKAGDRLRQGRLLHAEQCRGAAKMAGVGHREKVTIALELHIASISQRALPILDPGSARH